MRYILPPAITKGDTIGLITPSSPLIGERLQATKSYLESKGFKVKIGKNNSKADRFMAGSDEERADDIMSFFKDSEVKALVATGGGYSSQRVLPLLDYELIRNNPKALFGFSDTTALELGLLTMSGLISFTGFTGGDVHDNDIDPLLEDTFLKCLKGVSYTIEKGKCLNGGVVEGPLVGGNLNLITALMGTPYQPDFKNAILLIEEVRQEPYIVDSMLSQLKLSGVLEQVSGIVFGKFHKCDASYFPERDGTTYDIVKEYSSMVKIPVVYDFCYGHIPERSVLPVGHNVVLDAEKGKISIVF